jgi:hypothetical protein
MTLFVLLYKRNPPDIGALAGFFLKSTFSALSSERVAFGKADRPPRIIARVGRDGPCGA